MRHGDTWEHEQPQTKVQIIWRDHLDRWADILLTYNRAQSLSSFLDFWLLTSTYEGSVSRFGNVWVSGYSARWAICELNKLAYSMSPEPPGRRLSVRELRNKGERDIQEAGRCDAHGSCCGTRSLYQRAHCVVPGEEHAYGPHMHMMVPTSRKPGDLSAMASGSAKQWVTRREPQPGETR
jgi:hypothetical protein